MSIGGTITGNGLVPPGSVSITFGATAVTVPIGPVGRFSARRFTDGASPARLSDRVLMSATRTSGSAGGASLLHVVGTTAPAIGAMSASPNVLGPPNHRMIGVFVACSVSPEFTGAPVCALTVASNEPVNGVGDGNTSTDWLVIGAHKSKLRAERLGGGSGQVYSAARVPGRLRATRRRVPQRSPSEVTARIGRARARYDPRGPMPRNAEVIRQWTILRDLEASRRLTIDDLAEADRRHDAHDPARPRGAADVRVPAVRRA